MRLSRGGCDARVTQSLVAPARAEPVAKPASGGEGIGLVRRFLVATSLGLALLAAPGATLAAPKAGCATAGGFELKTVQDAAALIFPHLLPGQFATQAALAAAIDAAYDDKRPDNMVCVKTLWGEHLNPNSHWYRVGVELLGEPTHLFLVEDNRANGS